MPEGNLLTRFQIQYLMEIEPCLAEARGTIVERAACRGPWASRVDLKAVRRLPTTWGNVEVTADLINVLNLLNSSWGQVQEVQPSVPILRVVPFTTGELDGPPGSVVVYGGPLTRDDEGRIRPLLPYTLRIPDSQWQAQVGLRVRF